jgi:hypothetical protein
MQVTKQITLFRWQLGYSTLCRWQTSNIRQMTDRFINADERQVNRIWKTDYTMQMTDRRHSRWPRLQHVRGDKQYTVHHTAWWKTGYTCQWPRLRNVLYCTVLYCTVNETDFAITQANHQDDMQTIPRYERNDYVMNLEKRTNWVDFIDYRRQKLQSCGKTLYLYRRLTDLTM